MLMKKMRIREPCRRGMLSSLAIDREIRCWDDWREVTIGHDSADAGRCGTLSGWRPTLFLACKGPSSKKIEDSARQSRATEQQPSNCNKQNNETSKQSTALTPPPHPDI